MKLWSAATACGALLAARFTTAIELDLDDDGMLPVALLIYFHPQYTS